MKSRNAKTMLFLWIFAVALCALVIVLMLLRGPATVP
jgi:hypothetical protein